LRGGEGFWGSGLGGPGGLFGEPFGVGFFGLGKCGFGMGVEEFVGGFGSWGRACCEKGVWGSEGGVGGVDISLRSSALLDS